MKAHSEYYIFKPTRKLRMNNKMVTSRMLGGLHNLSVGRDVPFIGIIFSGKRFNYNCWKGVRASLERGGLILK